MKIFLALFILISSFLNAGSIALDDPNIQYRGTKFPEITANSATLYRFPNKELFPKTFSDRPTYSSKSAKSLSGTSISFKTASPVVKLSFEYEGAQFAQFGVYQNKKFMGMTRLNNPKGAELLIKSEKPGEVVEYRITGPASQPMFKLKALELEEGHVLEKPNAKREKIYVALGDSISHGLRRDNTAQIWPWLLAEALNYELYSLAVGGSFANPDQARVAQKFEKIDLMTILWGYNDCINRGKSLEEYLKDMNHVIDIIRAKHPETKIYLMNLLQTKNSKSKKSDFTIEEFRIGLAQMCAERVAAGDKNLHFMGSDKFTNKDDDLCDVVHLSHQGHQKVAEQMISLLK